MVGFSSFSGRGTFDIFRRLICSGLVSTNLLVEIIELLIEGTADDGAGGGGDEAIDEGEAGDDEGDDHDGVESVVLTFVCGSFFSFAAFTDVLHQIGKRQAREA